MEGIARAYREAGRLLLLAGLVLALVGLMALPAPPALAQQPDETGQETEGIEVEPAVTPEPTETVEPQPDEETIDPADTGPIEPPSEEELGEPVKDEAYVSTSDVVDEEGGVINIFDLSFVASKFGSTNPAADVNLDGQVNIFDLALLASSYDQAGPANAAAAVPQPEPVPMVDEGVTEFGALDLAVEAADVGASAATWRPLRVGLGFNYLKGYDYMDGQTNTPPDFYAFASVGGVPARTATWWNSYEIWPNWRLGWWRYSSFPWTPSNAPDANNYSAPVVVEIRDDDGRVCYGYYGCRDSFEVLDISSVLNHRAKTLTFYPNTCRVRDEAGNYTNGYWLDSGHNRCRVHLQAWGSEWPRGYVSYFLDAEWN